MHQAQSACADALGTLHISEMQQQERDNAASATDAAPAGSDSAAAARAKMAQGFRPRAAYLAIRAGIESDSRSALSALRTALCT